MWARESKLEKFKHTHTQKKEKTIFSTTDHIVIVKACHFVPASNSFNVASIQELDLLFYFKNSKVLLVSRNGIFPFHQRKCRQAEFIVKNLALKD